MFPNDDDDYEAVLFINDSPSRCADLFERNPIYNMPIYASFIASHDYLESKAREESLKVKFSRLEFFMDAAA